MTASTDNHSTLPCADKLSFDTAKAAEATAVTAHWQRGVKLHAYQCRHCGLWHLSSNPKD